MWLYCVIVLSWLSGLVDTLPASQECWEVDRPGRERLTWTDWNIATIRIGRSPSSLLGVLRGRLIRVEVTDCRWLYCCDYSDWSITFQPPRSVEGSINLSGSNQLSVTEIVGTFPGLLTLFQPPRSVERSIDPGGERLTLTDWNLSGLFRVCWHSSSLPGVLRGR